jgi:WD40 repeat protein
MRCIAGCPQAFLSSCAKLVSSSKDGSLRVWDLTAQRCCQTVTGFKGEVWSLDVNLEQTRLVAGEEGSRRPRGVKEGRGNVMT